LIICRVKIYSSSYYRIFRYRQCKNLWENG
jgi:hypothetical protein